jgi:hypothetical protein
MRLTLTGSLSTLAIILVASAVLSVLPARAIVTRIYLSPSTNSYTTETANIGYVFNVTVWVESVPSLAAWNLFLGYNDSILNVTRWFEPENDSQYIFAGKTTSAVPSPPEPSYTHIAPGNGSITVAATLFPTPPTQQPSSGTGKLCILEFNVTELPSTAGSLFSALMISNADTFLLDQWGTELSVTKQDGSYSITWVTPPIPHMSLTIVNAANPHIIEFGPHPPLATGQAFAVKVGIRGLSSTWHLTQASFSLSYNSSVVEVVGNEANVSIDLLWNAFSVVHTLNRLFINVSTPSFNPSGDLWIATAKFTVMNQETAPPNPTGSYIFSDLSFENVFLYRSGESIPVGAPEIGSVKVFAINAYTLTIEATLGGSTSPAIGIYTYLEGETVSVQGIPASGYIFGHWQLDSFNIGTSNPVSIEMSANHTLHGVFGISGNQGDVNRDGKVDVKDVYMVARAYGSCPGQINWNSVCDINYDGKIDVKDYYIVCKNYGKTYP